MNIRTASAAQHARWVQHILETPELTDASALYSFGVSIAYVFGDVPRAALQGSSGLTEYLLRYANGEEAKKQAREFRERQKVLRGLDPKIGELSPVAWEQIRSIESAMSDEGQAARRARIREFLSQVVSDRDALIQRVVESQVTEVLPLPAVVVRNVTKRGIELRHHIIINDADSFERYCCDLFLDHASKLGNDLGRCAVCGKFFLKDRDGERGRPVGTLCKEHISEGTLKNTLGKRRRRALSNLRKDLAAKGVARALIDMNVNQALYERLPGGTREELLEQALKEIRAIKRAAN